MGRRRPLVLALVLALAGSGSMPASGGYRPSAVAREETPGSTSAAPRPSFLARHRRPLLVGSAAGCAASGIAALLYRRQANDRFADYRRTADPERLRELYDEAEKLDNRAGACFITAETLFVAALYLGFFVDPAASMETGSAGVAAGNAAELAGGVDARPDERGGGRIPDLGWEFERGVILRWSF